MGRNHADKSDISANGVSLNRVATKLKDDRDRRNESYAILCYAMPCYCFTFISADVAVHVWSSVVAGFQLDDRRVLFLERSK